MELNNSTKLKAENLRKGNYVKYKEDFIKVKSLLEEGINFYFNEGDAYGTAPYYGVDYEYSEIQGIPLDEELLLKCGFEVIDDNPKQKPHYEGDILFRILEFEFTNSMCDGFKCYQINDGNTIIKYLHQLQNLCSSLGKELSINL